MLIAFLKAIEMFMFPVYLLIKKHFILLYIYLQSLPHLTLIILS